MSMQALDDTLVPLAAEPWTVGWAALMLAMWAVMMAAMMLPSAAPAILLYATLARRRAERGEALASAAGAFASGYVLVWALFSVAATALQFALEQAALMSPAMRTTSVALAGAALVGAGVYQWTSLKHACLRHCRSPLEFITEHWRSGASGALRMGATHGAYCVGCCWVLMLLLFVGGVMNFAWIAGLALFVLVEKVVPAGHRVARASGVALVAWGVATWLAL